MNNFFFTLYIFINSNLYNITFFFCFTFLIYFTSTKICQMSSLKQDQSYIYIPKHS